MTFKSQIVVDCDLLYLHSSKRDGEWGACKVVLTEY